MTQTPTVGPPRQRWVGAVALVVVVLVAVVGLVAFHRDPVPAPAPTPATPTPTVATGPGVHAGRWTALPDLPLAPRWGSVGGATGTEVVVVGGSTRPPCFVDCGSEGWRSDGAAYDVEDRTWRSIADAPEPIAPESVAATGLSTLVVQAEDDWLAYDADRDVWRRLASPGFRAVGLTADGARVYALGEEGEVSRLDLRTDRWSALVPLPAPLPTAPVAVAYPGGVAVVGGVDPSTDGRVVLLRAADVEPGWARSVEPGGGWLDPATGAWEPLPPSPGPAGTTWIGLPQTDGRPPTSGNGHVWDPQEATWVGLGTPVTPTETHGTVVYAGRRIYLAGGLRVDTTGSHLGGLTRHAFVWTP